MRFDVCTSSDAKNFFGMGGDGDECDVSTYVQLRAVEMNLKWVLKASKVGNLVFLKFFSLSLIV